eukprot:scaffold222476_cov17-Tisochrysis_lutea.AAC.3
MSASTPSLRSPHQQQAAATPHSQPLHHQQQECAEMDLHRNPSASPHTPQESNSPGTSTNSQVENGSAWQIPRLGKSASFQG